MEPKNTEMTIPKKRIDYKATLLSIPEGESRRIKAIGKAYTGYTVAATRLRQNNNIDFRIESQEDDTILVTRNS